MKDVNTAAQLALTLAALKKHVAIIDKERKAAGLGPCRDEVAAGDHDVIASVSVSAGIKVGVDHPAKVVQKAKPWALFAAALNAANKALESAGAVGIDLEAVVKAAEAMDAKAVKKAREATEAKVAALKQACTQVVKGKVTVATVDVKVA